MSFRTVVITQQCKCSYKNDYLIVRGIQVDMIHLSEIGLIIFDTTAVSITAYLLNELIQRNIEVIFCDEQHNPSGNLVPLYGSYNSSGRINEQLNWGEVVKQMVWTQVIKAKINKQSEVLKYAKKSQYVQLDKYIDEIKFNDSSNREGHAAKVYFNSLFGKKFNRNIENPINSALNYGYALLLSVFNKEIVAGGYLTQIGICHRSELNPYNLASDLMEPFRPIVDKIVYDNVVDEFNNSIKCILWNILNIEYRYDDSTYYLSSIINLYVKEIMKSLRSGEVSIQMYEAI